MFADDCLRRWKLWGFVLLGVIGCAESTPVAKAPRALDPSALVPAGGTVTVNGKPMETIVVTFLPPNGPALGTAETDKDGKYQLASLGGPGVLPGEYKVALSYLVSADGEPQGRAARTSVVQGPGMLSAKEQFPAEYSDLGRSMFSRMVGPQGGTFDFDVPVTLPVAPGKKKAEDPNTAEKQKTEEQKSTEKRAAEKKE